MSASSEDTYFAGTRTLASFRRALAEREAAFSVEERRRQLWERKLVVDQAILMLRENYAHLPLKRAMHAVDPVQRLRLLRLRLSGLSPASEDWPPDFEFHREMYSIFTSVRDLHTRYYLPEPYNQCQAFLPFSVGEFFERDESGKWETKYVVTSVTEALEELKFLGFAPGAEIRHWNGVPMGRAVALIADRYSGSNLEARRARGLARLTLRPLALALPPEEDWVHLRFLTAKHQHIEKRLEEEMRLDWGVVGYEESEPAEEEHETRIREALRASLRPPVRPSDEPTAAEVAAALRVELAVDESFAAPGLAAAALARKEDSQTTQGLDRETEIMRRERYVLFPAAPSATPSEAKFTRQYSDAGTESGEDTPVLESYDLEYGGGYGAGEGAGLIRILSFEVEGVDAFVDKFQEMLEAHQQRGCPGLILDLRGNGGGRIPAGERLLQMLTPQTIEPARFQFYNSPLNYELCRRHTRWAETRGIPALFEPWIGSIQGAVETGDTYSRSFTITPKEACNDRGQRYFGPTVLITDANCYSTADIFAAGFKDHEIGRILGVHRNTGAGGANNVQHSDLLRIFGGEPYRRLPRGIEMSVALRRSMRVRKLEGTPLEDLGVVPDDIHRLTRDDVLEGCGQLYRRAVEMLQGL